MKTSSKAARSDLLLWLSTLALMLLATVPTLCQPVSIGHDSYFHSMRIMNIAREMLSGNPFPSVYSYSLEGLGYGSPLFYCDFFLYPFAALHALGLSIEWTFKLLQAMLPVLTFVSMYLCGRAMFPRRRQAHIAALGYAFSFYGLIDIYTRAAVGEALGLALLPAVCCGYWFITRGRTDRWWVLALSMAGIVLSHVLSVVIAVIMLLVLMAFDWRLWLRKPSLLRWLCCAAALCCGLTCWFWLPMLEQMVSLPFLYSRSVNGVADFLGEMYTSIRLLCPPSLANVVWNSDDFVPCLVGVFGWAAILLSAVALWRTHRGALRPLAACLVFAWLCGRYSLTQLLAKYLAVLQFPWRLLLPATLMLALFFGAAWGKLTSTKLRRALCALIVLSGATSAISAVPTNLYELYDELYAESASTVMLSLDFIGNAEYLPADMEYRYEVPQVEASCSDEGVTYAFTRDGQNHLQVTFSGNDSGATIDLPLVLYLGYEAETDDGRLLPVSRGEQGLVRVDLGELESGSFTVRFEGTPLLHAARWISLAFAACFALHALARRRASRRHR